mmetsp:Transcript_3018/g.5670  ORF Transcript_3018/g.5670 Transcript_3018/m.5670 type:complete len:185 (-) Transcript_3018:41-595(-)
MAMSFPFLLIILVLACSVGARESSNMARGGMAAFCALYPHRGRGNCRLEGSGRTSLTRIAGQAASTGKSGGKLIVTQEEYDGVLEESRENPKVLTLVFFTASWCGPCRQSLPAVRAVAREYTPESLKIYEVDVDESTDIVASTGIESVPTIFVMVQGKLLDLTVGSVTEGVLKNVVKSGFKKVK